MAWQLWVAIGAIATGLIVVVAIWLHHAQEVFDRIVDESRTDDLTQRRRRRARPSLPAPPAAAPITRRTAKRQP